MPQFFGRSPIASALLALLVELFSMSSLAGAFWHELWPTLFGISLDMSSSVRAPWQELFGTSSFARALRYAFLCARSLSWALCLELFYMSSSMSSSRHQLFGRSSITSAFWKVVYCMILSVASALRELVPQLFMSSAWHQLLVSSSIASALREPVFCMCSL